MIWQDQVGAAQGALWSAIVLATAILKVAGLGYACDERRRGLGREEVAETRSDIYAIGWQISRI